MTSKQLQRSALLALGLGLLAATSSLAAGRIDDYRSKMEKWVETRQILSEERSEWDADRETLAASQRLLREQKKALEEAITELEQTSTAADDERRALMLERADLQRSHQLLEAQVREMEERVQELAPQLPQPLHKKLEPLLVQIPDDPDSSRLQIGQRLMNVLGVLAQAEKWNGTATFVGETRAVEGGQRVAVRTLYWGLGQAIYVDAPGEHAGIGRPTPEGWEFSDQPELASDAKLLLDIYEGNVDVIEFVDMPVEVR